MYFPSLGAAVSFETNVKDLLRRLSGFHQQYHHQYIHFQERPMECLQMQCMSSLVELNVVSTDPVQIIQFTPGFHWW